MKTWLGAAALSALTTLVAIPALAAAPVTHADPAKLERGEDLSAAHLEGSTFVDGDVRVDLGGRYSWLLGVSGDDHLVAVSGKRLRVRRIDPQGDVTTVLRTRRAASVHLSTNGRKLVVAGMTSGKVQPQAVHSARSGTRLASRTFAHYPTTLGMKGARVFYTTWERGTFVWNSRTDKIRRITRRPAGEIDLGHDLLASYTGDPYEGGCMKLTALRDPSDRVWTSCSERVESFSPDGERIATVALLSDGLGPNQVVVRTVEGAELATYRTTGWFGTIDWEDDDTLMLESHGTKESAWVRCDLAHCENASDPEATVFPRISRAQRAARP